LPKAPVARPRPVVKPAPAAGLKPALPKAPVAPKPLAKPKPLPQDVKKPMSVSKPFDDIPLPKPGHLESKSLPKKPVGPKKEPAGFKPNPLYGTKPEKDKGPGQAKPVHLEKSESFTSKLEKVVSDRAGAKPLAKPVGKPGLGQKPSPALTQKPAGAPGPKPLAAAKPSPAAKTGPGKLVEFKGQGFSISHPAWPPSPTKPANCLLSGAKGSVSFTITRMPSNGKTIKDFVSQEIPKIESGFGSKVLERKETVGHTFLVFTGAKGNTEILNKAMFILHGPTVYRIQFSAPKEAFKEINNVFWETVKSVKFQ